MRHWKYQSLGMLCMMLPMNEFLPFAWLRAFLLTARYVQDAVSVKMKNLMPALLDRAFSGVL